MSDLATLRTQTRLRLGIPPTDGFFNDARIDDSINFANETIAVEHRWPWNERTDTETVAAGVGEFSVPANWTATRSLFLGDTELLLRSPSDLDQYPADQAGDPRVWAVIGDDIVFRPGQGGPYVLTHRYYITPARMTADSDEPGLPRRYHSAIVAKACELLSVHEDARSQAMVHRVEYDDWIRRMRKDLRASTGPTRPRVRPGGWV